MLIPFSRWQQFFHSFDTEMQDQWRYEIVQISRCRPFRHSSNPAVGQNHSQRKRGQPHGIQVKVAGRHGPQKDTHDASLDGLDSGYRCAVKVAAVQRSHQGCASVPETHGRNDRRLFGHELCERQPHKDARQQEWSQEQIRGRSRKRHVLNVGVAGVSDQDALVDQPAEHHRRQQCRQFPAPTIRGVKVGPKQNHEGERYVKKVPGQSRISPFQAYKAGQLDRDFVAKNHCRRRQYVPRQRAEILDVDLHDTLYECR
jgi:hypothetical protein